MAGGFHPKNGRSRILRTALRTRKRRSEKKKRWELVIYGKSMGKYGKSMGNLWEIIRILNGY
jgi:hypothetical protein